MTLAEKHSIPQPPEEQYTQEREIFKSMDKESLLLNYRNYTKGLSNPAQVDSWPALKLGLELCIDELKQRGIAL